MTAPIYDNTGPEPRVYRPKRRFPWLWSIAGLLTLACGIGAVATIASPDAESARITGGGGVPLSEPAAPTAVSPKPARTEKPGYSAGTWKVPTEVSPGTYVATAAEDSIMGCYWARLRDFDGDVNSIIANDIIAPGARGRVTIKKSDAGVEFAGECVWKRDN